MRFGMGAFHRSGQLAVTIVEAPGDHHRLDSTSRGQPREVLGLDIAIGGRIELVSAREVQPQLEAAHHALFLFRHLAVDDALGGSHPLHAAALQQADVAQVVFMAHAAFEHVGHGLEATVRVGREAGDVVVGVL